MRPVDEVPPAPPPWIVDLVDRLPSIEEVGRENSVLLETEPRLEIATRSPWALIGAALPGAVELPESVLRREVRRLYERIREAASEVGAPYPLRFWNLIPFIHEDMDDAMDRYMVFNAGRHDALSEWLEDPTRFPSAMPAATGIGFRGRDLVVYCFAGDRPGESTENPRQTPAYRYSRRYGPLPPCFARAMRIPVFGVPTLLIAGTSSVRGESSVHVGSLDDQIDETFRNLERLVDNVVSQGDNAEPGREAVPARDRFGDLRVYHVREEHAERVRRRVEDHFPNLRRLELVRADICRRDLLVEIEGVARVGASCPVVEAPRDRSLTTG